MATPSRARRIYDHLGTNGTILAVIGIILAAAAILVPVYVSSGSTTTTTTNNYGTQPQPEFDGQTKTCPAEAGGVLQGTDEVHTQVAPPTGVARCWSEKCW